MYNLNEIWGDYNVCFAITDPIQRTNKVSVNPEIGLNSLSTRRWYQNFFFFCKIVHGLFPAYLTAYMNFGSKRNHDTR